MTHLLVAQYEAADARQTAALHVVDETARQKMVAVLAMRDAGMTYAEIGGLVGLSVAGVQRIAYKRKDQS